MDLKVYQKSKESEVVFFDQSDVRCLMTDQEVITPVIAKILESMKNHENTSSVVKASYVEKLDPQFASRYPDKEFNKEEPLHVDINLKALQKIEDLYRDQTTFYKTLRRGEGTASPYHDCKVTLKIKIEVDGVEVFCHKDPLS